MSSAGRRLTKRLTRRLAAAVAAVGLAGAGTVLLAAAPGQAAELVRTATFTGIHDIPEPPADPGASDSDVLTWIQLDVQSNGLPPNAQVVDVELTVELAHPNQGEIDLYLARPAGQNEMVRLMSDIGGDTDLDAVRFTFDDHAPTRVGVGPVEGARHRPNDSGLDADDAAALVAADDTGSLGFLASTNPWYRELWAATNEFNGVGFWRLFALDDTRNDVTGSITFAEIRVTFGVTNDPGPGDPEIDGPDEGPADPYPSEVELLDLDSPGLFDNIPDGPVAAVAVHLDGLVHASPDDLNIALQGPNGAVAVLLAAGDVLGASGPVNLRFVHGGPSLVSPVTSGTFGPRIGPGSVGSSLEVLFPGSGLSGAQTGGLEQFAGIDPEGIWRLFVYDRVADNAVTIGRWSISLDLDEPPTAVDDHHTTFEDVPLVVDAPGVLGNDTDPEGATLVAELVDGPEHGTLAFDPDGGFTYTPDPDFEGVDSFTYRASDGAGTDTASVIITVQPVNDPPVAMHDSYTGTEDEPLVVSAADGVLDNDTDVDGSALEAAVIDGPDHGTLVLDPDGGFTFTPDTDFEGVDSFTYSASDGVATDTAIVTITVEPVNDPPVAVDDSYTGTEDEPLVVSAADGVLDNDTDVDNEAFEVAASVETPPAAGTLELEPDGSFTYVPAPDDDGVVTFTYRVSDGDGSDTATVTIDLASVNDDPVANPDDFDVDEDGTLVVVAADGVLANDTDVDGDQLYAVVAEEPEHGTLVLDPDGGLTYTPDADFHGTDAFAYVATDVEPDDGVDVAAASAPAVVEITVAAVNDPPVAVDDTASVAAGGSVDVDVLANDSDVDGDVLTVRLLDPPARGTASCTDDGCTYAAPAGDPGGEVTFAYEVDDGAGGTASATVVVDVEAAPPVAPPTSAPGAPGPGPGGPLARTGADVAPLLWLAAALVAIGLVTTTAAGRRHRPAHARR